MLFFHFLSLFLAVTKNEEARDTGFSRINTGFAWVCHCHDAKIKLARERAPGGGGALAQAGRNQNPYIVIKY
jgi:hypothetical protein